ncbi:MAG: fucose isomerase [Oscillospiraceae bacterium]|nr:fucose isomerase [Oscillospiraceae bacterium]
MIRKAADIKLKVLPVLLGIEHLYYYEGPCRLVDGEALQPGFDKIGNEMFWKDFLDRIDEYMPMGIEVLEPVRGGRTDDWDNHETMWELFAKRIAEADVAFVFSNLGVDDLAIEFGVRYSIPMVICPTSSYSPTSDFAALKAKNPQREVYAPIDWSHVTELFTALRAKKVLQNTRVLLASRGSSTVSYAAPDTFANQELVTKRLGVLFRHVSIHELMDQMTPAVEGGNPTTPGRKTLDLTPEDQSLIENMANELLSGADYADIERQYLLNSLAAHITVKKHMDMADCNAFTAPCPDACSTRRLNEQKFTFCLNHSLLNEQGIPSACEFDANSAVSMQALIAISGQSPYHGNTSPLPREKNGFMPLAGLSEEKKEELKANPDNLYYMHHSVPHRCLHTPNEKAPYGLNHFAYEQKFGAVMRYDFNRDIGQVITVCRFSPDAGKLFIGRGTIVGGDGYDKPNCRTTVIFRVTNQNDFYSKQLYVGNHCCMVYGDYTTELKMLADVLGVEALLAL